MITEKLQQLNTDLLSSYTSIANRGGIVPSKKNSNNLAAAIATIPTGGGSETWQPHPDWWNIDTLISGNTPVLVLLITDRHATTNFAGLSTYFSRIETSDGATYTADAVHTWDLAQDKPCAMGYNTRYVACYALDDTTARAYTTFMRQDTLADTIVYFVSKNLRFNAFTVGGKSSAEALILLQSHKLIGGSLVLAADSYRNCASLVETDITPSTPSTTLQTAFTSCYALSSIKINGSTIFNSTTSVFSGCYSLARTVFPPGSFNVSFDISAANLSKESLGNLIVALSDRTATTPLTLTLGSHLLAKLTPSQITAITTKNWNVL